MVSVLAESRNRDHNSFAMLITATVQLDRPSQGGCRAEVVKLLRSGGHIGPKGSLPETHNFLKVRQRLLKVAKMLQLSIIYNRNQPDFLSPITGNYYLQ